MKKQIILSLLATLLLLGIFRWQESDLVTPQSPRGIIDLEFARAPDNLKYMLLFLDRNEVQKNIYLYFILIAAVTWFLLSVTRAIKECKDWTRAGTFFSRLSLLAGLLGVLVNLLLLEAVNSGGRKLTLQYTSYIAAAKFILIAVVLLYIAVSLPIIFQKRQRLPN